MHAAAVLGAPGCFNEAGAVMPRKDRMPTRGPATAHRFNEAGAVMPRKAAIHIVRLTMSSRASMRPGQ